MASSLFQAKIEHNEKTIMSLYRAQYHAYEKPQMIVWMVLGFLMIAVAVFSGLPAWVKAILVLIGAWMIVSMDFPSQIRADRAVEARHGSLPKMQYEFHKDQMKISGEGSMSIPYKKIERLTEDANYLYICMGKDSICMIDRTTIKPKTDTELKEFLSNKTKLDWQNEKSLLALNLADIMAMMQSRKNNKAKKKK